MSSRPICRAVAAWAVVGCLTLTHLRVFQAVPIDKKSEAPTCCPSVPRRQDAIPVHYVRGTHYQVGQNIGRTYGAMIQDFLNTYEPLQMEMLPLYEKPEGRKIYEESLKSSQLYFPQYVIELRGMADGARVPFHHLFLMTLDDTLAKNMDTKTSDKGPIGCSSVMINQPTAQLLGHTEDALNETVNHYYIVAAHVTPDETERGGIFHAREEKFEALTYAGHLPGYASGHNQHGLVFSINTIFVSQPLRGKIPREFITRALLSSKADMSEIVDILMNEGVGTADGFHVNLAFMNVPRESRVFHSIEVAPKVGEPRSDIFITDFKMGSNSIHTNKLLHLKYPELHEGGYESSIVRENRYNKLTMNKTPSSVPDLLEVLGNKEDDPYPIFSDRADARVSTINLGVFDFDQKTWTMWPNNPITNPPLVQLPLTFTDLVSQTRSDAVNNHIEVLVEEFYPSL